jgi:cyclopropane fatty-acyl-phospholipid synthase-like methyltransferase
LGIDPFPSSDFDEWADTYDSSVSAEEFLFIGYKDVLNRVVEQAGVQPGGKVLDLGTGTGNLATLLVRRGAEVWGTDFSQAMLLLARRKVPQAHFSFQDIRQPWPSQLPQRFDCIVSAYVFHHFELEEKVGIVKDLVRAHLQPLGRLVIADITFPSRPALDAMKDQYGDEWEAEHYWIADEAIAAFQLAGLKVKYEQVSICAGIFTWEAVTE